MLFYFVVMHMMAANSGVLSIIALLLSYMRGCCDIAARAGLLNRPTITMSSMM